MLAPLEPILHPSPWRLRLLGLSLFVGHPLFGWIWSDWLIQSYENAWLRGLMSALGLVLTLKPVTSDLSSQMTRVLVSSIAWIELPLFFSWMYLSNASGTVWLSSVCAMILIYYHLTDWRIATLGTVSGALIAWGLFRWLMPSGPFMTGAEHAIDAVVIGFSWGCALLLGVSSANLRREHLAHTLTTIGIMAHELRTPLSTAALIGDAIQLEVQRQPEHPRALQLDKLALRLHTLVRNMNHQIDTQIANAKLLQLPRYDQFIPAGKLVNDVTEHYPYQSSRQRECVKVTIHQDFLFLSSYTQFSQVLDNLIKNALHSLMAANSKLAHGALCIDVGVHHGRGRISIADQGMGIDAALLPKIFKPFFSSDQGTGHGLGLAFCEQVVHSANGSIQVKSEYAVGAIFTIELPIASQGTPDPADFVNHH
ncbi:sensor histidine kinase [Polaromonas sp.]|uniref:sensor histidine kinase n=1 Tax=Polaromonas sp. TaxID=1869339 RepID=UPI002FCA52CD